MPSWHLVNVVQVAAEHKYTFYKPTCETIAKVAVGETVKLIFAFESDDPAAPRAERMWVVVDSIDGQGGFTGRLDNAPKYIKDLSVGDHVSFRDIHIINTEHDDDDNLVERYLHRCFVTHRILKDGQKIGYLYREKPEEDRDSGWRIMAGDESDEYMDRSENIAYVSLGAVLNCDDSVLPLLEAPVGSAFKLSVTGEFVEIEAEG